MSAFRPLVTTVAALHSENIFHRDIKPANIFLGYDGKLVLGDFGIAFLPDLPERLTFTNESVGPRDYMPPWAESEERLETISGAFDVYMLGKLLWCMVAGRLKLTREWYKRRDFDLTVKFPNDPQMHMINAILEKCLHDDPEKCVSSSELLTWVDAHLSVMQRGGQMLRDGVPRLCHVCGQGNYQPETLLSNNKVGALRLWVGGSDISSINVQPFACNSCGHITFFKQS